MLYSFPELLVAYRDHVMKQSEPDNLDPIPLAPVNRTIMGIAIGVFFAFLAVSVILFITALVLIIMYHKLMPTWALVLAILCLVLPIPGGVVIALLLALLARKD